MAAIKTGVYPDLVVYDSFDSAKMTSASSDCPVAALDDKKQRIRGFLKDNADFGGIISESLALNTMHFDPAAAS